MHRNATFNARVWRKASEETLRFARRHSFSGGIALAVWVAGSIIYGSIQGWDAVMEEVMIFASYTVIPVAGFAVTLFLWNLFLAPFQLLENQVSIKDERETDTAPTKKYGQISETEKPDYKVWAQRKYIPIYDAAYIMAGYVPQSGIERKEIFEYEGLLIDAANKNEIKRKHINLRAASGSDIELESLIKYLAHIGVATEFCEIIEPYLPKF